mmetsp:Transcript_42001/g.108878  ORF Transcript_42001/g.108878 Transcript_42001/m.108878 type:complete len:308 (+) Transcript_42001:510-1433(+)
MNAADSAAAALEAATGRSTPLVARRSTTASAVGTPPLHSTCTMSRWPPFLWFSSMSFSSSPMVVIAEDAKKNASRTNVHLKLHTSVTAPTIAAPTAPETLSDLRRQPIRANASPPDTPNALLTSQLSLTCAAPTSAIATAQTASLASVLPALRRCASFRLTAAPPAEPSSPADWSLSLLSGSFSAACSAAASSVGASVPTSPLGGWEALRAEPARRRAADIPPPVALPDSTPSSAVGGSLSRGAVGAALFRGRASLRGEAYFRGDDMLLRCSRGRAFRVCLGQRCRSAGRKSGEMLTALCIQSRSIG